MRSIKRAVAPLSVAFLSYCLCPENPQAQSVTLTDCIDFYGRNVVSAPNYYLNDVARAFLLPDGSPIIEYNPGVLSWLSWQSQMFWYAHECAHHELGHAFGTTHPLEIEHDADCHGIARLVEEGALDLDDIAVVQSELSLSPGDWTHLPGPVRAINLGVCLQQAGLLEDPPGAAGADSCDYAHDGACDEPDLCDPGTDTADCRGGGTSSAALYCCDTFGNRYCPIVVNPGAPGSPCVCAGIPGYGLICQ